MIAAFYTMFFLLFQHSWTYAVNGTYAYSEIVGMHQPDIVHWIQLSGK